MNYKLLSIIFGFSLALISCRKLNDCNPDYNFQIPLILSATDSVWLKGDTLNIGMYIENTLLKDIEGDRIIKYPNFDPYMSVGLVRLDSAVVLDAYESVDIIIDEKYEYSFHQTNSIAQFLEIESISNEVISELELSIKFKEDGKYALLFNSSLNFENSNITNRCEPQQGLSLEPSDLGTTVEATFIINEERVINEEILNKQNLELLASEFFVSPSGHSTHHTMFYFKVE